MTSHRLCAGFACALILAAGVSAAARAQERPPGLLDNLFGGRQQPQAAQPAPQPQREVAQAGGTDVDSRIDRIESALRQLTGTIEELQHQNQMLQMQLKRMQDDTEYRFQQMGSRGGGAPVAGPAVAPVPPPGAAPPANNNNGRRSDVFDPAQHPNAPGTPRALGNASATALPPTPANPPVMGEQAVGAPGGRDAGAPLDLSTLAGNQPEPPAALPSSAGVQAPMTAARASAMPPVAAPQGGQLPPPPPRNTSSTGVQLATLPPTASPKDEYELAYGYVLHKDYGLAEQAFRDFVRKYPNEKLLPEAEYWLGESQFQQQRYRDAAESFLAVSTKYEHSSKAPDALLRLGQSLAELHQKEAACATLAEVSRKFPHVSANVKRSVAREQKRVHC